MDDAQRLTNLEGTVKEIDDLVLGKWDVPNAKRQPGLVEKVDCLVEQVSQVVKLLKWGIGPLVTVCAASACGTSAKEYLPMILKVVSQVIGLH